MRTVPKKNYILLGLLGGITILAVVYMSKWYRASENYYLENSVMKDLVGEVKELEFENYVLENPDVVIYISNEQTETTRKFEKKLKSYILEENLKSHFVYVNGKESTERFLLDFKKKYFMNDIKGIEITYPNLMVVENGKVKDILYRTALVERNVKDIKPFLQRNGVLEDA
ncbi:MAG: hypothetical protein HFH09_03645 [Bacilli bacterium]|jgi:predicted secreted acid phosphatase|nr:hypothetical protein [Bacilli bacterium]